MMPANSSSDSGQKSKQQPSSDRARSERDEENEWENGEVKEMEEDAAAEG